jgi:anti-anti-sigma regulatory factor
MDYLRSHRFLLLSLGEYRSASSRNTAFVVAQIFSVISPKLPVPRLLGRLPSTKCRLQFDGTVRALRASGQGWEEVMLSVHIENIGDMAVIECEERVVRSEAAFKLREAVTSQRDARIIVLDLSEVRAIESSGLGMLGFLQRWAHDHDIRLKLFNPTKSVQDRLEHAGSVPEFDIATLDEMMALLARADSRYALAA